MGSSGVWGGAPRRRATRRPRRGPHPTPRSASADAPPTATPERNPGGRKPHSTVCAPGGPGHSREPEVVGRREPRPSRRPGRTTPRCAAWRTPPYPRPARQFCPYRAVQTDTRVAPDCAAAPPRGSAPPGPDSPAPRRGPRGTGSRARRAPARRGAEGDERGPPARRAAAHLHGRPARRAAPCRSGPAPTGRCRYRPGSPGPGCGSCRRGRQAGVPGSGTGWCRTPGAARRP